MLPANEKWFTEVCKEAGSAISWGIDAHLAHETTDFQTIDVYRTTQWGNLMVIDGFVMLTSRDNFLYHEMLTHPALFSHPDPKQVVIIGGGDCGTLREVLGHQGVESVTQVEIDEQVTRLAEQHFPELCERNGDPRARLMFDDGLAYIKSIAAGSVDVIIVDSTDPIGPAEGLFGPGFIADCFAALAPGGILVQQSESPLLHQKLIGGIRANMEQAGFDDIRTLGFPQPCYPSGWWSATQARKGGTIEAVSPERFAASGIQTRYFNPGVHVGALATQLP
ncbi:polyamine aminopropyltransferase [Wenzhouxiangella limi]|uniref:Polyamine aminopropyltransferase n=1 Tax=Wenzhouxiangella limi TaxID=2707351 RepID=A0A845UUQ6_9GAMM|nr:polyamine aminopropyltransferase [Wenzhouxiangella limi]NDY94284.1 polyamine aminopropyltransferase [Wenzhouxiangella limi]